MIRVFLFEESIMQRDHVIISDVGLIVTKSSQSHMPAIDKPIEIGICQAYPQNTVYWHYQIERRVPVVR